MSFFHNFMISLDLFFHNLVCLFLVPVPARPGAHAWHVFNFVCRFDICGVEVFSRQLLDNNELHPDNM